MYDCESALKGTITMYAADAYVYDSFSRQITSPPMTAAAAASSNSLRSNACAHHHYTKTNKLCKYNQFPTVVVFPERQ